MLIICFLILYVCVCVFLIVRLCELPEDWCYDNIYLYILGI